MIAPYVTFMLRGAADSEWGPLKMLENVCNMRDMKMVGLAVSALT
jgi:hypothetical protein